MGKVRSTARAGAAGPAGTCGSCREKLGPGDHPGADTAQDNRRLVRSTQVAEAQEPWPWARCTSGKSSGASPRLGWSPRGFAGPAPGPAVPRSWTTGAKLHLIALHQPAAQRRRGMTTGLPEPCACWRARPGGVAGCRPPCPMRRCASGWGWARERPGKPWQKQEWVHPKGKRRLRGPHGLPDVTTGPARPNPMTPNGRWSALTRPPPSCWPTARPALPAQPGRPRRQRDYEYRREGTRNLFLACAIRRWRGERLAAGGIR